MLHEKEIEIAFPRAIKAVAVVAAQRRALGCGQRGAIKWTGEEGGQCIGQRAG